MNDDNIFGEDTTDALDLSDEGLGWSDAGDEDAVPSAEAGVDTDDQSENDDTADSEVVDQIDDADLPEAFRGKSPAELAKIIADSQSHIGKQANELGALRQMVEQLQTMQQAQPEHDYIPASEYIQSPEDGVAAYREVLDLLDKGEIGPEAVDEIIDATMGLDSSIGLKMHRDFSMRLARAEMMAQMQPTIAHSHEGVLRQATSEFRTREADAEPYTQDIVRIVQSPASLVEQQVAHAYANARTVPDLQAALSAALQVARGADPTKSKAYGANLEQRKLNEQVETGNATPGEQQLSEAEAMVQSISEHRAKRTDANLFAGFGG